VATQYPAKKGVAFTVVFPILDADGDLVTGAAGLDSEISKDGGTFVDCTNEATEIATSSGMYKLSLTATEMDADIVAIIVKTTTTGAKTTPLVIYTSGQTLDEIDANVDAILEDTGTTLETHLTDIKGTGFVKDTHSLPQCLTATGFSTHAAADIWAVATRALTDKDGFALSSAGIQAIWDALTADLITAGSIGKLLVDDIDAAISSRSSHSASDIWAVATRSLTDKAGFALSSAANLAIWHVLTADIITAATIGLLLKTDIDATISSRSSHSAADIWTAAGRELSTPDNYKADVSALALEATLTAIKGTGWTTQTLKAIGDYVDCLPASLGDIVTKNEAGLVDAVWDEEIVTGHDIADTAGEQLNDAATAGAGTDPEAIADAVWNEALSDHIASGTTGEKLYGIRARVPLSPWKRDDMMKVISDIDYVREKIRALDSLKETAIALSREFKSLQDSIRAISKLLAPLKSQGKNFKKLDSALSKIQKEFKQLSSELKALPVSEGHQRIELALKDIRDKIPPPAPEFPPEVNEQLSVISAHSEQLLAQLGEFKREQESLSKKSSSALFALDGKVSDLSKFIISSSISKLPTEALEDFVNQKKEDKSR